MLDVPHDKRLTAGWTDERVGSLKSLWESGLSAAQIAGELGGFDRCQDRGRSAVLGKIHRLGLSGRIKEPKHSPVSVTRRTKTGGPSDATAVRIRAKRTAPPASSVLQEHFLLSPVVEVDPIHIPFMELAQDTCKFECSGQEDVQSFSFCGHAPAAGRPYCIAHCKVVYLPAQKRKERPTDLGRSRGGVFGKGRAA